MTPFRSPAYRWLWLSTLGSTSAQGIDRTATAWLALDAGGGAVGVGIALAARTAPSLLFGLTAGTFADRNDRRRQLLAVAGAGLPLMLLVAWMVNAGAVGTWQVTAISFILGCLQVFDGPARQALIPDTAGIELAPSAFALNALGSRLAFAFGALLAGLLIPVAGVAVCYLGVAAGYGLSAALVMPIRVERKAPSRKDRPPFRRALLDAARLVVDVPAIRILSIAGITAEISAFSYATALPVLVRDVLQSGAEGLGTLNASASIGGMVAVGLLSLLPLTVRREPVMAVVFVLYGLAILGLGAAGGMAAAAPVMFLMGCCAASFDVLQQTLIQTAAPDELRGRAAGVWVLGVGSAPAGHLEMGLLVSALGAQGGLGVNGLIVLVAAATLLLLAPAYRPGFRKR